MEDYFGGKDKMKDLHYPQSQYISKETRRLWEKMVKTYYFQDSAIEKTVQNYSSTVNILCDYWKKDFLAITDEEATLFIEYLDRRVTGQEKNHLSASTAFTYKKNLRSVGNYFEKLQQEALGEKNTYHNPFRGKVVKNEEVRAEEAKFKRQRMKDQVKESDVRELLKQVKAEEAPQYYFILSMIACFAVSSYDICNMKKDQIQLKENEQKVEFIFYAQKMMPKTKDDKQEKESKPVEVWKRILSFDEEVNAEFIAFYQKEQKKQKEKNREYVFYNRNGNVVNFKTISSVLKKHKDKLNIPYTLTTKELSGSLCSKEYGNCSEPSNFIK